MKLKMLVLLILNLSLILTACSAPNIAGKRAIIDWVDAVVLNDIHYTGYYNDDKKLTNDSIEGVIGEVKFNVASNIHSPDYKLKNGDATFLPKGMKLYKIRGYNPEFRIAANVEGKWRVYEAGSNPRAKKGEDLLDIRDEVLYIGINSETDGKTELGAIREKARIDRLVNMVLNAEVKQNSEGHDGQRYFISFHLLDGLDVTRCFWVDTGELSRGILLPKEFGIEIEEALKSKE